MRSVGLMNMFKALSRGAACATFTAGLIAFACQDSTDTNTSNDGMVAAPSGDGDGAMPSMTTESNQPAPNENTPGDLPLQNPAGGGSGNGQGMTATSNPPVDPTARGAVPCGGAGTFCEAPNLTCCTPAGGGAANDALCVAAAAQCPTGTLSV